MLLRVGVSRLGELHICSSMPAMTTNDMGVIHPTPLVRKDALMAAREVLLVKAGKYADRPLVALDLIILAEFILGNEDAHPASLADFEASVERIKTAVMTVVATPDHPPADCGTVTNINIVRGEQ